MRALAQSIERTALRIDRAVGIALTEIAGGIAHGLAGAAKLIQFTLSLAGCGLALLVLLILAQAAVLQLVEQFVQPIAQRLLVLPQLAKRISLGLRLARLALARRAALALILALLKSAVAQLLLLADHVAELVERRHHVLVALVHIRHAHLQIFHHLLQLLQKLARGVLGAVAREIFQSVEHALEIARAERAGIGAERAGELAAVFQLLRHRLHETVHGGAQLVHQRLDLLVGGAAVERLLQRVFGGAQGFLRIGNVAVLEAHRHLPKPLHDVPQIVVALGSVQRPVDRTQAEIDAGFRRESFWRHGERIERGEDDRAALRIERQIATLLDQSPRQRFGKNSLGQAQGERLAPALVAGIVAGDQRHDNVGARPGMIGEVLDRLANAVSCARLRQDQREIGRTK